MIKRSIRRLAGPGVAILAMLPGFALPFVLTAVLGQHGSDPFFLAISVSLVLCNVLGNTIEMHSLVQVGRIRAQGGSLDRKQMRRYRRKIRVFTGVATLIGGPALIGIYYATIVPEQRLQFLMVSILALAIPLIGGEASSRSGQLIACGNQATAILLQAMRSLAPLCLLLIWPSASLLSLAASMVLGETVRLLLLSAVARRLEASSGTGELVLETRGLITQSVSTSAMQSAPVADRIFLSGAPAGSVSSYELADKVFFAGVQFLNLSYLVSLVRNWSELRSVPALVGFRTLRRDLMGLTAVTVGASLIAVLCLQLAPQFVDIPSQWSQGLAWAQLVLISLPMVMLSMACSRLLVVADRQGVLLWFATCVTLATVAIDWLFFSLMGPIGIPLASVCVRAITATVYLAVTFRCLRSVVGADLTQIDTKEHEQASVTDL